MASTTPTGTDLSAVPAQRSQQPPKTLMELIRRRRMEITTDEHRKEPISYEELARRAGSTLREDGSAKARLPRTTLHDYSQFPLPSFGERGGRMPHVTVMAAIAAALGVTPEDVLLVCAAEFGIHLQPMEGGYLALLGDRTDQEAATLAATARMHRGGRG